jgi:hypothetical protein
MISHYMLSEKTIKLDTNDVIVITLSSKGLLSKPSDGPAKPMLHSQGKRAWDTVERVHSYPHFLRWSLSVIANRCRMSTFLGLQESEPERRFRV